MNMRNDILERKEEILQWIAENETNAEMARRLECKVDTLKGYYKKWGIEYGGNQGAKGKKSNPKRKTAEELSQNPITNSHRLRLRILEDGVREHRCEQCENTEWMGEPIPLELHHIDGNHNNNDLSNIQLLCPNCHAQTDNFSNKK